MCAAIGCDVVAEGPVAVSLGTSGTAFAYRSAAAVDPLGEAAAFCDSTGGWLPLACTLNCTSALEWVRQLFAIDHAAVDAAIANAEADGLAFLPYLSGERTPNRPEGAGVFIGLRPSHDRDAIVQAVATIAPSEGGRIVSLVIAGAERILPKTSARPAAPPIYWGCYPMVPWAGRLGDGRIPTDEGEVRIEPNLSPSAIHGLGFERPWTALEQSATTVTMECALRGRGWPFGGSARQTLRLSGDALDLELAVGGYTRPGPAGLGWHPWFTRPPGGDLALTLDAHEVLALDRDLVPTGEVRAVSSREDLRAGPLLGG